MLQKWMALCLCAGLMILSACGGGGGGGGGVSSGDGSGDDSNTTSPTTFTISGTIFSEAGDRLDRDVNDANGPAPVSNNSADEAQALSPLPVTVGGYVDSSDAADWFQADLQAGDVVRLSLPDAASAALDLTIYDASDPPIAVSSQTGISSSAALTVTDAATYYIEVSVSSGATTYHLNVGAPLGGLQTDAMGVKAEFVPGEVLVKFNARSRLDAETSVAAFAHNRGLALASGRAGQWRRMKISDTPAAFQRLGIPLTRRSLRASAASDTTTADKNDTWQIVQALRRDPDVAWAEPNYIRRALEIPNDPLFSLQWNLGLIRVPEAWDVTTGSATVIVAVVDTGVLFGHPDLQGKLLPGYDFVSDLASAGDGNGADDNATDPGDSASGDSSFHGTHVAGIVAAAFDNGEGVAGVGGATMIRPVRVLGRNGGTDTDVANGILWAAGLDVDITVDGNATTLPGADPPADIINLSLGGEGSSSVLYDAIYRARTEAGAIIIAAAGNSASNTPTYPAAYAEAISVSAVGADGLPAPYTNFGETIDIAAPGGNLYTDVQPDGYEDGVLSTLGIGSNTHPTLTYGYYMGTSMAVPHVAGVAALMKAVQPTLSPDEFYAYLVSGSLTGSAGTHDAYYGYGLIDALHAVRAASTTPPTVLSATPHSLYFDYAAAAADLFVRKTGADPLTVTSVDAPGWLAISGSGVQPDPQSTYTVTPVRDSLTGGVHTGTITIASSANTVSIPVRVEVLPEADASTGIQYLSLLDTAFNLKAQVALTPDNGQYTFTLSDVPAGSYYLVTGSDLNYDHYITDEGEAVGFYPTVDDPQVINVHSDVSGLQFVTGFSQWAFTQPTVALKADRAPR